MQVSNVEASIDTLSTQLSGDWMGELHDSAGSEPPASDGSSQEPPIKSQATFKP